MRPTHNLQRWRSAVIDDHPWGLGSPESCVSNAAEEPNLPIKFRAIKVHASVSFKFDVFFYLGLLTANEYRTGFLLPPDPRMLGKMAFSTVLCSRLAQKPTTGNGDHGAEDRSHFRVAITPVVKTFSNLLNSDHAMSFISCRVSLLTFHFLQGPSPVRRRPPFYRSREISGLGLRSLKEKPAW
ncbi:hypothetical protein SODALDRAFT_357243 [Sodiomyces alkalinus F11]|uniref:Uncharacterized protein n=1 Tax=Sodiomyces alkalinus (strain CBS 110278 / VKM F-3762 / F11) TaxID=1314773 RepID=A0A3N2Q3H4_SODAK|nr:hypothetical protein SODALDRAFT_357243 [Sodiomyces alkalinus F11]ROT41218.1 hypothetical protein SODALDRAFT_357243 [Sodiomyces alkalinus F11]